ncbi:hypothetical protein NGRA_2909 [Nosema granulosis]|uniref:Integrase catalytic domain-containing protein n=1 Tax=Nosema granulosis TaxID=83296 RepID=A0A9P6KX94_9MICR|nr:hypothetical protein NGRA_2909 [Nosema granulosis]
MLISDGANENTSELIGKWVHYNYNKINHHITSAYHHCSNGRIERFNRTLSEGIKNRIKMLGFRKKVEKLIEMYNDTVYSAIEIKSSEAILPEMLNHVKQIQFNNRIEKKYKNMFRKKTQKKLQLNDFVLIEDAIYKQKGQPKFLEIGEVLGILNNDTYWVAYMSKYTKYHITQLRKNNSDDFYL